VKSVDRKLVNAFCRTIFSSFLASPLFCLNGCFTAGANSLAHPIGPAFKEIRQTSSGDLALVYADQHTGGSPSRAPVHVYVLDMKELDAKIERAWTSPGPITKRDQNADVFVVNDRDPMVTIIQQEKISGQWIPNYFEKGVKLDEATTTLAPWFNPDVSINLPGRKLEWAGPHGARILLFSNRTWRKENRTAYLLFPPAFVLDIATSPIQMTYFLLFFKDE